MSTGTSLQDTRIHRQPPSVERYTIEQLARSVGMSPRNIRAHQTRKLIDPPVREGRTAYYDGRHLRRLETIQSLQEQGFNLVAIEAILCGSDGSAPDDLTPVLHGVDVEDPRLISALCAHGVVGRAADGSVLALQGRMLRSALDLDSAGLAPAQSLRVLVEVLDSLRTVADALGQEANARILALRSISAVPVAWDPVDRDDDGAVRGLADLFMEAFRLTMGNRAGDALTARA